MTMTVLLGVIKGNCRKMFCRSYEAANFLLWKFLSFSFDAVFIVNRIFSFVSLSNFALLFLTSRNCTTAREEAEESETARRQRFARALLPIRREKRGDSEGNARNSTDNSPNDRLEDVKNRESREKGNPWREGERKRARRATRDYTAQSANERTWAAF